MKQLARDRLDDLNLFGSLGIQRDRFGSVTAKGQCDQLALRHRLTAVQMPDKHRWRSAILRCNDVIAIGRHGDQS